MDSAIDGRQVVKGIRKLRSDMAILLLTSHFKYQRFQISCPEYSSEAQWESTMIIHHGQERRMQFCPANLTLLLLPLIQQVISYESLQGQPKKYLLLLPHPLIDPKSGDYGIKAR